MDTCVLQFVITVRVPTDAPREVIEEAINIAGGAIERHVEESDRRFICTVLYIASTSSMWRRRDPKKGGVDSKEMLTLGLSDAYGLPNDLGAAKAELAEWRSAIESLGVIGGPSALRSRAVAVLAHHAQHERREERARDILGKVLTELLGVTVDVGPQSFGDVGDDAAEVYALVDRALRDLRPRALPASLVADIVASVNELERASKAGELEPLTPPPPAWAEKFAAAMRGVVRHLEAQKAERP